VLAAVIIDAVIFGMIDLRELRRLRRVARIDFWIAVAAIVGVLSSGVLAGVVIGVALSLIWLIHVAAKPVIPRIDGPPDMIILRLDFGLSFATTEALDERLRAVLDAEPQTRVVVLDFAGVDFIDSQGSEKLGEIRTLANATHFELRIARLKPQVRELLESDGVVDQIGADHLYDKLRDAVSRTA
jgi:anti-anti-sigma factor